MIAMALACDPGLLIADEPTTALDVTVQAQIMELFARIRAETRMALLLVTHDLGIVAQVADRVAVMSIGRVEQIGDPRSIYRTPANRFVASFIGETNLIAGTLVSVEGEYGCVRTALGEFRARLGSALTTPGSKVECMVRPECLHLGQGGDNAFRATLARSVYLGEVEQLVVEAGGLELRAVTANPSASAPGGRATVDVHFASDDAIVLPAQGEGGSL